MALTPWPPCRPWDARLRRSRLALALAPLAWAIGGFSSSQVRLPTADGERRPACVIALGDPPADGLLARPPLVVALLAPDADAPSWLAAGATAVWQLGLDGVEVHRPEREPRLLRARDHLSLPRHPRVRIGVGALASRVAGSAEGSALGYRFDTATR